MVGSSKDAPVGHPVVDAARGYLRRGWLPLPIPSRQKGPRIPGWTSFRTTEEEISGHFSDDGNVGIILGSASGQLVDVDIDVLEALALADRFLPKTDVIFGRVSKPRSHWFYVADPLPAPQKFCAPGGTTLLELRAEGQQTVVPPSVHLTGEIYRFDHDGEPAHVDGRELAWRCACFAATALLAINWPKPGQRNDAANALAGMLLRGGWTEEQAKRFVEAVACAAGDEESRQRVGDVISTAKRLAENRPATGAPTLAKIIGDEAVECVRAWLKLKEVEAEVAAGAPAPFGSPWPESLGHEAFWGLAGEIVSAIEPHSEADPAALLLQLLVAFGNVIGHGAFFAVERSHHYANLFALIIGPTAKGRKGTAWGQIANILGGVDSSWLDTRVHGGVGSGEGIIWHVRDPILKGEKLIDEGVGDKRLVLLETEFAQVLAVAKREGSTASEVLRRAWDGTPLQTLTKNNPARAVGAHVSAVGHITRDELLRHLDETEIANGLMNRFIFCCARRSKALPDGGSLSEAGLASLTGRLQVAVTFGKEPRELKRDAEAAAVWRAVYGDLSDGKPGLLGAVVSRSEAQVLRLSMIYALLDSSPLIRREHLMAALAVWQYAEASALHVFGDALGDPVADEILRAVRSKPEGLTRSEVHGLFGRNRKQREIDRAVGLLLSFGLISIHIEDTNGRPAQRLVARRFSYEKNEQNERS
jgi:hypothetical protein